MTTCNLLKSRNILALLSIVLLLTGCGILGPDCVDASGERIKRQLELGPFTSIRSEGAIDLVLVQTDQPEVVAVGTPVMLDLLEATVENGKLVLGTKGCWKGDHPLVVHLATPAVEEITLLGSGSLSAADLRKEKRMSIALKGSGSLSMGIHAERLELDLRGSGQMDLNGMVTDMEVEIAGSGNVHARELQAMSAEVVIKGSGDAEVKVSRKLDATIKGSGNIRYSGQPDVKTTIKGSGTVVPL